MPPQGSDPIIPAEDERLRTLPWYKTTSGVALLSILGLLVVVGVALFAINVGADEACIEAGGVPATGQECDVVPPAPVVIEQTETTQVPVPVAPAPQPPDTVVINPPDTVVTIVPSVGQGCIDQGGSWDGTTCTIIP